jgi:hypothetical protein
MPPCSHTPRTVLTWATLGEWLDCARKIDRRRASRSRNLQAELHVRALPVSLVYQCSGRATLRSCDRLLKRAHPFLPPATRPAAGRAAHRSDRRDCQPHRSHRPGRRSRLHEPRPQQPQRGGRMTREAAHAMRARRRRAQLSFGHINNFVEYRRGPNCMPIHTNSFAAGLPVPSTCFAITRCRVCRRWRSDLPRIYVPDIDIGRAIEAAAWIRSGVRIWSPPKGDPAPHDSSSAMPTDPGPLRVSNSD